MENLNYMERRLVEHFIKNQSLPNYYNPWNDRDVKDFCPTLTVDCGCPSARTGLLIVEVLENEV